MLLLCSLLLGPIPSLLVSTVVPMMIRVGHFTSRHVQSGVVLSKSLLSCSAQSGWEKPGPIWLNVAVSCFDQFFAVGEL